MSKRLLTKIITSLVNDRAKAKEYGVSLINIPDFDYVHFAEGLESSRRLELYFLGFSREAQEELATTLPNIEVYPANMEEDNFEWEIRIPIE